MDTLLAKLSEQQVLLEKQKNALTPADEEEIHVQGSDSSSNSARVLTPVSDGFENVTHGADRPNDDDTIELSAAKLARLKKELDAANDQIARQKHELERTRANIPSADKISGTSFQRELNTRPNIGERSASTSQANLNASSRPIGTRAEQWPLNEDARSESSDVMSGMIFNSPNQPWATPARTPFNAGSSTSNNQTQGLTWGQPGARPWSNRAVGATVAPLIIPQQPHLQQRVFSGPSSPMSSIDSRLVNEYNPFPGNGGLRRSNTQNNRNSSNHQSNRNNGWDLFPGAMSTMDNPSLSTHASAAFQSIGMFPASAQYQPRPIGTPLSPTAEEFRTTQPSATPWNVAVSTLILFVNSCLQYSSLQLHRDQPTLHPWSR